MKPYLVFDLRNHHFVAGVVDTVAGGLRWKPEKVQIWMSDENKDSVDEADLCFFRHPREKGWKPTSATALSKLSDNYEKIADLFGESDEMPITVIMPALRSLFNLVLKQHEGLEILFITDTLRVKDCLSEIANKINHPSRIILASDNNNQFTGYALLNVDEDQLPKKDQTLSCRVEGNLSGYRWGGNGFEAVPASRTHKKSGIEWARSADMERVGLIAFELIWSERLVVVVKENLEKLLRENDSLGKLFARMDKIYAELQGCLTAG